jgi:citronellol/citronellal dehydrogenase
MLAIPADGRESTYSDDFATGHIEERWFAPHVAYSVSKFAMSLLMLGVAAEFRGRVAVNTLWPRTAIETAAMAEFKPRLDVGALRSPKIMADSAYVIFTSDARTVTGNFFVDDEVLRVRGVVDLSSYNPPGIADIDLTRPICSYRVSESWPRRKNESIVTLL